MISVTNGVARHPLWRMAEPINLEIKRGEQIAIVGDNAAGKTRLVEVLTGHYPLLLNEVHYDFSPSNSRLVSENLKYISFRDSYGVQDGTYYYQQRWNQHDIADDTPTVKMQRPQNLPEGRLYESIFSPFMGELEGVPIISLSSGELRKFQMAKALATNPRILILDNPFIGLDAPTRRDFRLLLETLTQETMFCSIWQKEVGLHYPCPACRGTSPAAQDAPCRISEELCHFTRSCAERRSEALDSESARSQHL